MELAHTLWGQNHPQGIKEKILLLHGMGGTGALWRPIAAALEDEFAILAPDQRGHGKSIVSTMGPRGAEYTPLAYGQDLVETLEKTGFHPVWAVGHSMGVRSASALAHLRRDWVRGMVLIDLGFAGQAGGGLGDSLAQFLKVLPMHFDSRAEARDYLRKHAPDIAIAAYLLAVSTSTPEGGFTFPFDRAALIQTIEAARTSSVRNWIRPLASNGVHILVLRGAQSSVWKRAEFEEEKQRFQDLPHVVFEEVPDTGHGLPFEKRVEFCDRLRRFIRENS